MASSSKNDMQSQVKAGIKALMLCKKKMKKETLLDHDEMKVMLQISAIKVAPGAIKQTIKLPLPAPFTDAAEVCLFVKDLKRGIRVDHEKSARHWRGVLEAAGVHRVSEVMPLRQLKAEYSMYEAKRKLCDSYDVFLADARIVRLLPQLLGKHFVVRKKQPVAVNMEARDLAKEIDSALSAAYLHLYNSGDSSAVQVGRCGQTEAQLFENVMSAIETLRLKFPGGLRNVRSLHLKLDKSPAVPIFVSDVPANAVPVPAARREPGSGRGPVVGELSTARVESDVVVSRFGDVELVPKRPLSDDEEETDVEEEVYSRRRQGRKRPRTDQRPSASVQKAPSPAEDSSGDEEDDEDDEDLQLEAREKQFLDEQASEKAAASQKRATGRVKTAKKSAKKSAEDQGGNDSLRHEGAGTTPIKGDRNGAAKTSKKRKAVANSKAADAGGSACRSKPSRSQRGKGGKGGKPSAAPQGEKSPGPKSYSKKKVKNIPALKKVK